MTTVFNNGDWRVSNGGLTAESPNNNTQGAINAEYASTAIPDHAKTYYEFTVSGAAIQTAFSVGFGAHGSNIGNIDITPDGTTPKHGTWDYFSYNRTITNSGFVVSDPQDNAHRGPTANTWRNGAKIGVEVDRINNQVTFLLDGKSQGTFSIANLNGQSLFPLVSSWFRAGPVATINGNPNDTPTGFTNLDNGGGHPNPEPQPPPVDASGDTITVDQRSIHHGGSMQFTGHTDNPSQPVFVAWHTFGTPTIDDHHWVQANVDHHGDFTATLNVDHSGMSSTVFTHGVDNVVHQLWSGTP